MGKYRHNMNGSTELVLVKQNFLLRGIRDSRTLIVQVLIGAMHGLVVSILVIRNFALTEFAIARLHCIRTDPITLPCSLARAGNDDTYRWNCATSSYGQIQ